MAQTVRPREHTSRRRKIEDRLLHVVGVALLHGSHGSGRGGVRQLCGSGACDGTDVIRRVATVGFITSRENFGLYVAEVNGRAKELVHLLSRPIFILRENGFNVFN